MSSPLRQAAALVGFLAVCFAAAGIGGALTATSVATWYQTLEKPAYNPPDRLFGPVWTTLFAMMGVSAWLVWRRAGFGPRAAWALFAAQLALNIGWSALFFALRSPGAAFAEILPLWGLIAATAAAFWRISPAAGLLLVPYLLWVGFAAWLNFAIWRLNA